MSGNFLMAADYADLRRRVALAENLSELWNYFMSDFIERPGFLECGRRIAVEQAIEVLDSTAGMMMDRPGPVPGRNLLLVELLEAGLIHGSGIYDGRLAAILFVPEYDVGTMAMYGGGGQMKYARFWLHSGSQAAVA
jgi:hypothetical protein